MVMVSLALGRTVLSALAFVSVTVNFEDDSERKPFQPTLKKVTKPFRPTLKKVTSPSSQH